ncbi:magnesium transport protein CorA [Peptococcaceae bacterium CEB3]|nr:magnesium transport protein CorA [Peptococcaceae bacterium CEB3]
MERYWVDRGGFRPLTGESPPAGAGRAGGFLLTVLAPEEWGQLPKVLNREVDEPLAQTLTRLQEQVDQAYQPRRNQGFLGIHPGAEKLVPGLSYVCYRGLDKEGKEYPIRFFLSRESFVLLGWGGLKREQLEERAGRGLLVYASHLAQFIGSRVLEEHRTLVERFEDQMDLIEEGILKAPKQWQQSRILTLHQRVVGLKKSLNAHLSVYIRIANLEEARGQSDWQELVQDTQRELENVRQTHELVENLREAYQTALDNRANDIMKILTLLATVLLPINLLTSFFGMNFENMPLIHRSYGMVFFYVMCVLIIAASLWLFHKMKWQK